MNTRGLILAVALVAGAAAAGGWLCFMRHCNELAHPETAGCNLMAWMRSEFKLTPAQCAEIERLHASRTSACNSHCEKVRLAREREAQARNRGDTAAAEAAAAEAASEQRECSKAAEEHVHRVAAVMDKAQGDRYLKLVIPRLNTRCSMATTPPPAR